MERFKPFIEKIKKNIRNEDGFISPLGTIMIIMAFLFDALGIMLLFALIDDFGILDIMALIFVGSLMYLYAQQITEEMQSQTKLIGKRIAGKTGLGAGVIGSRFAFLLRKKDGKASIILKKSIKAIFLTFLFELIPYIGCFIPTWTITAYRLLKKG